MLVLLAESDVNGSVCPSKIPTPNAPVGRSSPGISGVVTLSAEKSWRRGPDFYTKYLCLPLPQTVRHSAEASRATSPRLNYLSVFLFLSFAFHR